MKWPAELLLIRHAESAYNILRSKKSLDPDYARFEDLFENDRSNPEIDRLCDLLQERHALNVSDRDTDITPNGESQARLTGKGLRDSGMHAPDVVFVSPYLRAKRTLEILQAEWPDLLKVRVYEEERIREQDHGLSLLYNDWRIYHVKHPEQAKLYKLLGPYDYRYVNGENVPDVRQRNRSWMTTLTREFAGKRVMAITHHLNILATRANFERLRDEDFIYLDRHDKPKNCALLRYIGNPNAGSRGRLTLQEYNKVYY